MLHILTVSLLLCANFLKHLSMSAKVTNHRIAVDGVDLFYRASGPLNAPVVLLLHGTYFRSQISLLCLTS